jgi:ribonucleoside-triphosphate reductase (thioredoxin)
MFSFRLPSEFVASYANRHVDWGYPVADGVSLGEITFLRTYSRMKPDGTKERWHEVCERVVNGMYSLQRDHCTVNRLPWDDAQATLSATEAFERMFTFRWLPPGRGLWMMGTSYVMEHRDSASLNNCAFRSSGIFDLDNPAEPFTFLMEASMLGIGVGFDTAMAYEGLHVHRPADDEQTYVVPDTREGWVESVGLLLNSYLVPGGHRWTFDYSLVRPAGTPIRGFGGTASGPAPLTNLHTLLAGVLDRKVGKEVDTELVVDIGNLIGVCVASGNVRRSALLALGRPDDEDFVHLKDPAWFPERNSYEPGATSWGWMSNNSISATVGMDYTPYLENIALNGEPGFVWVDQMRNFRRTGDAPDRSDTRVMGTNPCAEIQLEGGGELCCLVEVFPDRHTDMDDYLRTLKFAYLYSKTVALVPTRWERTNAIMLRNRRIGCSLSGLASFADTRGLPVLRQWMDTGYDELRRWDRVYSEWLCVRESIRVSCVKPSGSVSILTGSTPGVHWSPGGQRFMRAIRFGADDPMVPLLARAGYTVEDDVVSPATKVVFFPVATAHRRSEKDVTIFEKIHLASFAQKHWADNAVSVTVSFDPVTEAQHIETVLHMHDGSLKTVSFLPSGNAVYPQMPYTSLDEDTYSAAVAALAPVDLSPVYAGGALDAAGERFCTTDACELRVTPAAAEFENEPDLDPPASPRSPR